MGNCPPNSPALTKWATYLGKGRPDEASAIDKLSPPSMRLAIVAKPRANCGCSLFWLKALTASSKATPDEVNVASSCSGNTKSVLLTRRPVLAIFSDSSRPNTSMRFSANRRTASCWLTASISPLTSCLDKSSMPEYLNFTARSLQYCRLSVLLQYW